MTWQEAARIADDWQAKGNPGWELNVRRSAISDALCEAVQLPEAQGVALLRDPGVLAQAERLVAIATEHQQAEDNDDAIDLALIAGNREVARALIAHARSMEGGPTAIMQYWREYRRAIVALLERQPYQPLANAPKAPGWLARFVPNLALAEALSTGAETGPAIATVDAAFAKRQRDKRMFDPSGHDGEGQVPVLWNVRKVALLAAAAAP